MFEDNLIYTAIPRDLPGDYQARGINYDAMSADTSPKIGSFSQKFWGYLEAAVDTIAEIPDNLGKDLKSGYETAVSGVKTVVKDTTDVVGSGVSNLAGGFVVPVLLLAGALAVVLYYGGKSGAIRISR